MPKNMSLTSQIILYWIYTYIRLHLHGIMVHYEKALRMDYGQGYAATTLRTGIAAMLHFRRVYATVDEYFAMQNNLLRNSSFVSTHFKVCLTVNF